MRLLIWFSFVVFPNAWVLADSIAIVPEHPFYLRSASDLTRGWAFTVEGNDITVTKLGVFDEGGDGLDENHEVGLWRADGTLVASTVVPAGVDAELEGAFRYEDISPVTLPSDGYYSVGAYYSFGSTDSWSDTDDAEVHEAIFYRRDVRSASGFTFPDVLGRAVDPGYFGANFQFVAVPEPRFGRCLLLFMFMAVRRSYHRNISSTCRG